MKTWKDIEKEMPFMRYAKEGLREIMLSKIPKEEKMQRAIDAHSDAGAGHVIGYNSCRQEMIDNINKFFGE